MSKHPKTARSGRLPGAALALVLAVSGCDPATGWLELGIERELPRIIGPAASYDVQIEGLRYGSGEADLVVATGQRVRPEKSPVVDRIRVELHGVRYDRRRERVERVESARATARITAADLAAYLEGRENVRSASVTLMPPDRALVRIQPSLGGLTIPGATVDVAGRIVGDGSQIRFVVSDVTAAGLGLGAEAAQRLSELINPLVDLSGIPVTLRVTDVQVIDGAVRLEAGGGLTTLGP